MERLNAGLTNISQLVGLHYSNGQLIATDANTLFSQRTAKTLTTLEAPGIMPSGTTFRSSPAFTCIRIAT